MLSQEDFYDRAKDFSLLKDVEGKYFTYEEYSTLIKDNQTDKNGNLIYLYTNDKEGQYSYIEAAKSKGYSVLLFDGQLDVPTASMLEQKFEKSRFLRVDSDVVDRLIEKDDAPKNELDKEQSDNLADAFKSQIPSIDKVDFHVEVTSLGENGLPVMITQDEFMRRMKDMSRFQAGMDFYAQMPDMFKMVINSEHPLVKAIIEDETAKCADELKPVASEIKGLNARLDALRQSQENKKSEEISQEEKDDKANTEKQIQEQNEKKRQIIKAYAGGNDVIHQLIDLALLQNGMLKGASLDAFIKRSISIIK